MADEKTYTVVVTYYVKATDPKEAALQACSLANDMTPPFYDITGPDGVMTKVTLTDEEEQQALDRAFKGTLFPTS